MLGIPSNGLHTNGYSFARKLFFEIGGYDVNDTIPELEKSIGLTLLEPHINYTNHVFAVLDAGIDVKGIAHITGGGLLENIPRILPNNISVEIKRGSWPSLPIFDVMQSIGDVVLGLPSNGLHTNGYSFARKLFFEIGGYDVNDAIPELKKSVGLTLLEPHINYTNYVFAVLDAGIDVKGIAHITGGGLLENIPRILPDNVSVEIQKDSWPSLPVFDVMQSIGDVDEDEMFRAFNMGIGIVFIVNSSDVNSVKDALKYLTDIYEIGGAVNGKNKVILK